MNAEERYKANFAANLSFLCETEESIANLTAELEINRQQFNKYKSGQHLPSRRNIAKITSYFGVSAKDLFIDPARFSRVYAGKTNSEHEIADRLSGYDRISASLRDAPSQLADILGVHYCYQFSSVYPNRILRSVFSFSKSGSIVQFHQLERFEDLQDPGRTAFTFRSVGICTLLEGKIVLAGFEEHQQNEFKFVTLTPIPRRPRELMVGIACGVAATAAREPFATRVVFHKTNAKSIRPSHLRKATTIAIDSPELPGQVREYLTERDGEKNAVLRGV